MSRIYDKKFQFGNWLVEVSTEDRYGYFENQNNGTGGGLWFDRVSYENDQGFYLELMDYDGVFELPEIVVEGLRAAGYVLDPEYF